VHGERVTALSITIIVAITTAGIRDMREVVTRATT